MIIGNETGRFVLDDERRSDEKYPVKTVLLVGGTSGIGSAVAAEYLKRGVDVTIIGRKQPRQLPHATFVQADLSLTAIAKQTAEKIKREGKHFDVVLLTVGVTAANMGNNRTSEGIEFDLATSFLSRYVLLKYLNLPKTTRCFVMAYPGLFLSPASVSDINFDSTPRSPLSAHMDTHIFNEAMVLHYADKGYQFFGLRPGMVLSDGFRQTPGVAVVEPLLHLVFPTQENFAKEILLPLFETRNIKPGMMFNPRGNEISANKWFNDNASVASVIDATEALLASKMK